MRCLLWQGLRVYPDDVKGLFRRSMVYEHDAMDILTTKAECKEYWDPDRVAAMVANGMYVGATAYRKYRCGPPLTACVLVVLVEYCRADLQRASTLAPEDQSIGKAMTRLEKLEVSTLYWFGSRVFEP